MRQLTSSYPLSFILLFCALFCHGCKYEAALTETQAKEKYDQANTLIQTYSGDGDNYEQAETLADSIRRASPNSPYSYLIIADLKARQYVDNEGGDSDEIWALTDKVISLNSKIADAYVIRSKMSLAQGDTQRAQQEADQAIGLDSTNRDAMFAKAQAEQASGHYSQAEGWYLKAIKAHTDPDRKSNMYGWLAKMYLEMAPPQISKADQSFAESANLSPDAPWKVVNYAIFLNQNTVKYQKAAEYARRALAIMDFRMGRLQLGMAQYGMWATAFYQSRGSSSEMITKAISDIEAIERETGVTPEEAFQYASQHMKQSRIPSALISAGLI